MATYRRKTIIINKRFQFRFAVYVCGWIAAICFVYPLITENLFDYFIRYAASDPMGPELVSLIKTKKEILNLIFLTEAAFIAMTFVICIYMSHRIAGPIYKLGRALRAYGDGSWKGTLTFRNKDWFTELADDFNFMQKSALERTQKESESVKSAISRIESAVKLASPDVRQELERALVSLRSVRDKKPSA
ncbi:MAG: methyl-accepting chemotaxis protein [Oligoflexia bacterium]|nr:methyl-accepting chemotaxis protein [Oligoflexia bacterium]